MVARVNGNYNAGQFIGHSVDHFVVDCKSDISAKYDIGGTVGAIVEAVQTRGTVIFLGGAVAGATANEGFRVAVESPNAWTADGLRDAVRALGTVDGVDLATATVDAYTY
jgi:hypothetical protein|tara:strand:+ start:8676 stop:9005 length:330 start_codon:yes stop_codon:yes gene_type:complete